MAENVSQDCHTKSIILLPIRMMLLWEAIPSLSNFH